MSMNRRSFVSAFLAAPIIGALAACRDTNRQATETVPTAASVAIVHPTGADEVVVKLAYSGGLVPADFHFLNTPTVLVSGDRRVFTPAVAPAVYPGPLVPPVRVHQIDEEHLQSVLTVLRDADLLAAPVDYSGGNNIADAPDTVLTINAAGNTFVHSAYALGTTDPETGARKRLLDATNKVSAMLAEADGADQSFVPSAYRLRARALGPDELGGQDLPPTIVEWPATSGLALADAAKCARLDASAVGSLFLDANQNTFFTDAGNTYQLFVGGVLPGDPSC